VHNDPQAASLVQAALNSLDPETFDYRVTRIIPITILVDAQDLSGEIGERITSDARNALEKIGYNVTYQWGPVEGSHFITIFGSGNELEDGETFVEKLQACATDIAGRLSNYDWKTTADKAGETIKIAVAVASIATIIAVAPQSIVIGSMIIPGKVLALIYALGNTGNMIESFKNLFFSSKHAIRALNEGDSYSFTGFDLSLQRPLKISKPLRFKPRPKNP